MKFCRACNSTKASEEFYANKHQSDGLSSQCKACSKESVKRTRNKKKAKEQVTA